MDLGTTKRSSASRPVVFTAFTGENTNSHNNTFHRMLNICLGKCLSAMSQLDAFRTPQPGGCKK
jgi:hypothetical protein